MVELAALFLDRLGILAGSFLLALAICFIVAGITERWRP